MHANAYYTLYIADNGLKIRNIPLCKYVVTSIEIGHKIPMDYTQQANGINLNDLKSVANQIETFTD